MQPTQLEPIVEEDEAEDGGAAGPGATAGPEGAEAGGSLWEGRILSRQADMLRVSNLVP